MKNLFQMILMCFLFSHFLLAAPKSIPKAISKSFPESHSDFEMSEYKITKEKISYDNDFTMGYFIECSEKSSQLCQNLCRQNKCLLNEDSCEGCISSNNYHMYSLYRDLKSIYAVSANQSSTVQVFTEFQNERLFIIDSTSIFSLFMDVSDELQLNKIKSDFLSFCPQGSKDSFLALSKDENHFLKLQFIICQNSSDFSIFQIHFNKEYEKD